MTSGCVCMCACVLNKKIYTYIHSGVCIFVMRGYGYPVYHNNVTINVYFVFSQYGN